MSSSESDSANEYHLRSSQDLFLDSPISVKRLRQRLNTPEPEEACDVIVISSDSDTETQPPETDNFERSSCSSKHKSASSDLSLDFGESETDQPVPKRPHRVREPRKPLKQPPSRPVLLRLSISTPSSSRTF
ncbi:uncharacterized protein LOC128208822 [Mya arenaria]|uniref:uncharacterized protein LOC128208822 n=1 Tax=Mya arenaria TaxID=6604 RepID=UPI0022E111D8|nr:uncharacterized protein LOC128208822 [Mya arenaria]